MESRTVEALLTRAESRLLASGVPQPGLEAEFLLAHFLETDRGGLVVRKEEPMPEALEKRFEDALKRRAGREPLQYIVGRQEFYGRDFRVDPRVLIPRPETEQLVDLALGLLPPGPARAADLGTGSGCIAVTLAAERPDLLVDAVDLSGGALQAALGNAGLHQVENRIRFRRGDLAALPGSWTGRFDLVVSNPPYVAAEAWLGLAPEVRDHEPREALVPEDGSARMYAALAGSAWGVLKAGGGMVLELGHDTAGTAERAAEGAGFVDTVVYPDFQGIGRVLVARKGQRA